MLNRKLVPLILVIFTSFFSFSTFAHTRSQSFSQWHIEGNAVSVNFNILSREVTRLAADANVDVRKKLEQILIEHLTGNILAAIDNNLCTITTPLYSLPANKGYIRLEAKLNCSAGNALQIEMHGFFDIVPSHLHYARVIRASGEANEIVLSDALRKQTIHLDDTSKNYWQIAKTYINLGFEHILLGTDHLVFLLALLLLCHRFSQALILISGFTLGHSITLSLSVLGWLQPSMLTIEALIGFSIVLVGLENIQGQLSKSFVGYIAISMIFIILLKLITDIGLPLLTIVGITLVAVSYLSLVKEHIKDNRSGSNGSMQFLLTTAFGFIHGFGFAEVLREIGLPSVELGLALFAFNIGVEMGQLLALTLMGLVGLLVSNYLNLQLQQIVKVSVISLVLGIGSYWFIFRSLNTL